MRRVCRTCAVGKPLEDFRTVTQMKNDKPYSWTSRQCRKCENQAHYARRRRLQHGWQLPGVSSRPKDSALSMGGRLLKADPEVRERYWRNRAFWSAYHADMERWAREGFAC